MVNKKPAPKVVKGSTFEEASIKGPIRKEVLERREKIEDAFLKLCGIRKELALGKDKLLVPDQIIHLGDVLRWIRPKLLPSDSDAIQTVLAKLPWGTDQRCCTIFASDIALIASTLKKMPNSLIFTLINHKSFLHPKIDQYLAHHPEEQIQIPGQSKPHTWKELRDCESTVLAKLEKMQIGGGTLSSLESSIIYVWYREHFLSLQCSCCGVGGQETARLCLLEGRTRDGFTKFWNSVATGEPCRLSKKDAEEAYDFCKNTLELSHAYGNDHHQVEVYAIKPGQGPDWLPLDVDMKDVEFLQGLEDLKTLIKLEDTEGAWLTLSNHVNSRKIQRYNSNHEIWESEHRWCPVTQKCTNPKPAVNFADTDLKRAVNDLNCHERAFMFHAWEHEYQNEPSDALVLSSRSMTDLFKNVGKKLKDAEDHFRRRGGGNETVALRAIEAVSIHRSYAALCRRLHYAERQIDHQEASLKVRNSQIHSLTHLYMIYRQKVQKLMWVESAKKFLLYGEALQNQHAAGEELSRLKVSYDLQTTKLSLLEAEMAFLAALNFAAHQKITTLESLLKSVGGACSHDDVPVSPDTINWIAFEKDVEVRKQAVYRALKKSIASQIDAQPLKATQDWKFLQLLFDHVLENEPRVIENCAQSVYGSCIEVIHQRLKVGRSCKQFLRKMNPENEQGLDPKVLEELTIATSWRTYLPPELTDCSNHRNYVDGTWHQSHEIALITEQLETVLTDNEESAESLLVCHRHCDSAVQEAQKWREHYDLLLMNTKKESRREDFTTGRFQEWMNNTYSLLLPSGLYTSEKEKLSAIAQRIREITKERDDAVRKNEPLIQSMAQKDKIIDDRTREATRALQSQSAREETLAENIKKLESALEKKTFELEKARKDADKANEEWKKKIQQGHDKIGKLEERLKAKAAELGTMKLDYPVMQSQLDDSKNEAAKYVKMMKDASAKYKEMEKERDESRLMLRALRSNEQAEHDRINKAVRDAEAGKDASIAQLNAEIDQMNHGRRADQSTIQELSRLHYEYKLKDLDLTTYIARADSFEAALDTSNQENMALRRTIDMMVNDSQEVVDLRAKAAAWDASHQYGNWPR